MYSADSLMLAFEKGGNVSIKGAQITLRDVVVESEDAKLTFKSSRSNRVICRLITPTEKRNQPPSVGSEITVTGKVRGRGVLGNVTLDNCSVAVVSDSQDSQDSANLQQDTASAPADAPLQENTDGAPPLLRPEEVGKDYVPIPSAQRLKPGTQRAKRQAAPCPQPDQQDQTTGRGSDSSHDVPYRFYALLVLSGALGYSILSKLLGSTGRAMRTSRYPNRANPDEVRKAALEKLLLKSSTKK